MWPLRPALRATLVLVLLMLAAIEVLAELSPHGPTILPLTAGHGVTVGDLPGIGLGAGALAVALPLARRRRRHPVEHAPEGRA